jgi:uncharacterized membrane protein YfcA
MLLPFLVFCVAFLYSSVGFGGATSYLAIMSIFAIPAAVASSTALTLNTFVASTAFATYTRQGHLKPKLLLPLLITSVPAAFLGATLPLTQSFYALLLNSLLLIVGVRMLLLPKLETRAMQEALPSRWVLLLCGAILGLVSGMVGIGGGVFLSPLIVLAGWGSAKQAAAASAAFIVFNSISGLAGRAWAGTLSYGEMGWILIPIGLIGGLLGSSLGARYLSGKGVQRVLGVIMVLVAVRYGISMF